MARMLIHRWLWVAFVSSFPFSLWGLVWPTPNPAFQQGLGPEAFIQPAASGTLASGMFGCVRNGGSRFHEGIDLFPMRRDRSGEAADPVYSILPGRIVHVSAVSGHSNYGRYVVVEHDGVTPHFCFFVFPSLNHRRRGDAGSACRFGYDSWGYGAFGGGYSIPKSRASSF